MTGPCARWVVVCGSPLLLGVSASLCPGMRLAWLNMVRVLFVSCLDFWVSLQVCVFHLACAHGQPAFSYVGRH